MEKRISATDARRHPGDVMTRVAGGAPAIIEKFGEPVAAVVPVDWYEKRLERREARFAIVDKIRSRVPDYPAVEVEADIVEAIAAVRAERRRS